jgi:hypothetical protein
MGFAQNRKGETNPVWERDSVAKRPLKRLSFVAADEKAKLAWWPGSSGSNREFYLFGGLGKNNLHPMQKPVEALEPLIESLLSA